MRTALGYVTCDIDPVPLLLMDDPDTRHPVPGDVPADNYHRAILETNGYHAHVLVSTHSHHLKGMTQMWHNIKKSHTLHTLMNHKVKGKIVKHRGTGQCV